MILLLKIALCISNQTYFMVVVSLVVYQIFPFIIIVQ